MYLQHQEVDAIPAGLPLTQWSAQEFGQTSSRQRVALERKSKKIWALAIDDETVMIVGVLTPALISRPELWFLMCEGFKKSLRRNLLETRELIDDLLLLFPNVIIRVDAKYPAGQRFAAFMGFKQISHSIGHDGREYGVYEVTR